MDGINYQIKLAKLLIEHGANLDAKNLKNETPLATAMRNKNHSLVAVLIKAGSKFWLDSDEEGNTFLHYYATLAARTNSVRAHGFEENVVRRQRFEKAIQDIWQAAQNVIKKKGIDFEAIVSISFSLVPNTFFFFAHSYTHTLSLLCRSTSQTTRVTASLFGVFVMLLYVKRRPWYLRSSWFQVLLHQRTTALVHLATTLQTASLFGSPVRRLMITKVSWSLISDSIFRSL